MSATTSNAVIQMVTFSLNGEKYCVDVMKVKEIICLPEITKTTNSAYHVEGMINLRGHIIPIISLRKRLGLPDVPSDINTCVAVMAFSNELIGFIIDDISEVIRIKSSQIEQAANIIGQTWIEGTINLEEKMVVVLNLEHLR